MTLVGQLSCSLSNETSVYVLYRKHTQKKKTKKISDNRGHPNITK